MVTRAKFAFDKLKTDQGMQAQQLALTTRQLEQQTVQLGLQGAQLAQNLASIRQQINALSEVQAMESKRADLAVKDAEANLRALQLKKLLLNNQITQEQFDAQSKIDERAAIDRAIQKAEIEVRAAKDERDGLEEKQQAQRQSLQMQEAQTRLAMEQLPIQREQLSLQRQQNELAKKQFEKLSGPELSDARRKANEAEANSLGPLIEKLERMRDGSKELIDPLTTLETRIAAVTAVLARAGIPAEDMAKGFNATNVEVNKFLPLIAKLADDLTGLQKLEFGQVLKGLRLPEEEIQQLLNGSEALEKFLAKAKEGEPARLQLEAAGKGLNALGTAIKDFATLAAGSAIATLRNAAGDIEALWTALKVTVANTPAPDAWHWMVDTFNSVMSSLGAMDSARGYCGSCRTAVPGAWQWMVDSFNSARTDQTKWAEFKESIGSPALVCRRRGRRNAAGGLLGGRGTGTSDSNLAWVSRGEFITPGLLFGSRACSRSSSLAAFGGNLRRVLDGMGLRARRQVRADPALPAAADCAIVRCPNRGTARLLRCGRRTRGGGAWRRSVRAVANQAGVRDVAYTLLAIDGIDFSQYAVRG
jgi:hypothetical protein